jgi:hypothetical protein
MTFILDCFKQTKDGRTRRGGVPVVPATQEVEARGLLENRSI